LTIGFPFEPETSEQKTEYFYHFSRTPYLGKIYLEWSSKVSAKVFGNPTG